MPSSNKDDKVFFGSKKVDSDLKKSLVEEVFSNVSGNYDLMNDAMSFGIHRYWKDQFCLQLDNPSAKLLDVAGGTGDIASRFYRFAKEAGIKPNITISDINENMLRAGRDKLINKGLVGIEYVLADAELLPFADNSFDYYTVAFGIRNFTHISLALTEAFRVLKPGGKFLCLEFSKPQNFFFNRIYDIYSKFFIPTMGAVIAKDREAYKYLIESIQKFPAQEDFANLIKEAGFKNVSYRNLTNGVVAIHTGYKN